MFSNKRKTMLACVAIIALSGLAGCASTTPAAQPSPRDDLLALNGLFRKHYGAARERALAASEPFLVVGFDDMTLYRGGKTQSVKYNPAVSHNEKMVSHTTLAIYSMLHGVPSSPMDVATSRGLKTFHDAMVKARSTVKDVGFEPASLERQHKLLDLGIGLLARILKSGSFSKAELNDYYSQVKPLIWASVTAAAEAQLDGLNKAVTDWLKDFTADEWKALHVVVIGTHQARERSLHMLYFQALLGEPGPVEDRVIFCELLFTGQADPMLKARELLGTHLLDERASEEMLGDARRLQYDILGDAAAAYIPKLKLPNR